MANYPETLRYTKEHEWTRIAGKTATVGITEFAKDQLGPSRQPGGEQRDRQRRGGAQPGAPLRPRRIERQGFAHVTGNALDETHERFRSKA